MAFSITVRQTAPIKAAIASIDEAAWARIVGYPEPGVAELAETTLDGARLIVRRVSLVDPATVLVPHWRYHGFVADLDGATSTLDANHRRHAVVELACERGLAERGQDARPVRALRQTRLRAGERATSAQFSQHLRWCARDGVRRRVAAVWKLLPGLTSR